MTGFDNEETEINKEMLSILFNGKLKEGEDLSSVRDFFFHNERDVHRLRQFYSKRPVLPVFAVSLIAISKLSGRGESGLAVHTTMIRSTLAFTGRLL
jgi:hypothetical protein